METLKKGEILTIFGISEWMGHTTKTQVKATGTVSAEGRPIFTENKKGARKKFMLREFKKDQLVFIGEPPIQLESEIKTQQGPFTVTKFKGNACLNFAGHAGTIVYHILKGNINKNFTAYDAVIHVEGEKETPLFPEVPTSHAVVQRIRKTV